MFVPTWYFIVRIVLLSAGLVAHWCFTYMEESTRHLVVIFRCILVLQYTLQHSAYFIEEDADDGAEEDSDRKVHNVGELACDERRQHERKREGEQPLVHAYRPRDDLDGAGQEATINTRNGFNQDRFMMCCNTVTSSSYV